MNFRLKNLGLAAICSGAAFYGEYLQALTLSGQREYDWLTGHLGDLAAPSGVYLIAAGCFKDKYTRFAVFATTAGIYLKRELLDSHFETYDPQDLACFAVSYGLAYLFTKNDNLQNKIKKSTDLIFNIPPGTFIEQTEKHINKLK